MCIKKIAFFCFLPVLIVSWISAQAPSERNITIINDLYNENQIIPSPPKPKGRPSVALVLSGGGARGFAHLPVLELIKEYNIPVDIVIGTSVGSIVGGMYCAGYSIEDMKKIFLSLNWSEIFNDKTYESYEHRLGKHSRTAMPLSATFMKNENGLSLNLGSGILTGQYAYELLKKLTLAIPSDVDFDSLPIPFRATGVNLLSGDIEVFSKGDLAEAIRASMSIPAFFQPLAVDGKYYIDGGTRDNTPIDVAAKMGYDIIIASEISSKLLENYSDLSSNPVAVLQQMNNMEQSVRNRTVYKKASLVMFPDYSSYTILNFAKSHEIYECGAKSLEKYRPALQKLKDELNVSKESASSTAAAVKPINTADLQADYTLNTLPIITSISISGGDEQDKKLIEKYFFQIKNQRLTPELYESFEKSVYKSGRYNTVLTRITKNASNESNMEVLIKKKEQKKTVFLLGAEYHATLTTDAMNDITFNSEFQRRNFLGKGSLLSLQAQFITDYAFELNYIQPFGPLAYAEMDILFQNDRSLVTSGFDYYSMEVEKLVRRQVQISLGFPFFDWLSILGGVYAGTYNTEKMIEGGSNTSAVDFFAEITFDTLNTPSLPTTGFYVSATGNGVVPLEDTDEVPIYDVEELSFKGIVPLGSKFGFMFKGFLGSNYSEDMKERPELISIFGFPIADRSFFPQISATTEYGLYKMVFGGSLQFCPKDQLTILGGKALFAISGAVGNIWMDLNDITFESPVWRASLDIGIQISNEFGILLRGGAGKTRGEIYPFISFDLGKVNF